MGARPFKARTAHAHAIANGFAFRQNEIKAALFAVHDNRARRVLFVERDDFARNGARLRAAIEFEVHAQKFDGRAAENIIARKSLAAGQGHPVEIMDMSFALQLLDQAEPLTFPAAFAFAAHHMQVEAKAALIGYLWGWLENQVMAALKAVPLGQAAGQRILFGLHAAVAKAVEEATRRAACHPPELSTFSPGLGVLSARHETQYSRLFRS